MSYASERETLEGLFYSTWATATPVSWANVEYEPVIGTAFVEFRLVPGGSGRFASFGTNMLSRRNGIITIFIYTPLNDGTNAGLVLADSAAAIFKNANNGGWQGGNITCRSSRISEAGKSEEWYRHVVVVPYHIDETS